MRTDVAKKAGGMGSFHAWLWVVVPVMCFMSAYFLEAVILHEANGFRIGLLMGGAVLLGMAIEAVLERQFGRAK